MSGVNALVGKNGNQSSAEVGIKNPAMGAAQLAVVQCVKAIFPRKTWAWLATLIDVPERTAKHRIAGTREFSVDELRALLRSEHGLEILSALMEGADSKWWRQFRVMMKAVSARMVRARIARELSEAIDADRDLSAAINRAEAALSFSDEEFNRPHVDALRAMSRVPHRAVASPGRRR